MVTPTDQPILAQNQLIRCVPYLCVGRFLTSASFCTSVDVGSGAMYVNRKWWVLRLKNTVQQFISRNSAKLSAHDTVFWEDLSYSLVIPMDKYASKDWLLHNRAWGMSRKKLNIVGGWFWIPHGLCLDYSGPPFKTALSLRYQIVVAVEQDRESHFTTEQLIIWKWWVLPRQPRARLSFPGSLERESQADNTHSAQ